MRFLFLFFFPVFLIILGAYGAGSSLPAQTTVIRGVVLPIAQDELWKIIIDFKSLPNWHQEIEKVTPIPEPGSQKVAWHIEATEKQSYTISSTYESAPDVLRVEFVENSLPYTAKWNVSLMDKTAKEGEGEASAAAPQTFLKIIEISQTENPFARFFMQYFVDYESSVEEYLQNLAAHLKLENPEIRELVA